MTEQTVQRALAAAPRLERLSLSDCLRVSAAELEAVRADRPSRMVHVLERHVFVPKPSKM